MQVWGAIYLLNDDEKLEQNNTYSYTNTEKTKTVYSLGEGVVGQVGLQKEAIVLKDEISDDTDMMIYSGVTLKKPVVTYTYPLIEQNTLIGVVEFGSLRVLSEKEMSFLNSALRIFGTVISSEIKNQRVADLLKESEQK